MVVAWIIISIYIVIFTDYIEDTYYIKLSGNSSTPRLLNVYQCDNGEYVSQFSTCNGFFDCVDNSDEVNCGELNNDVIGFWCDVRWFIYHININIYIQVRDAHVIFRVIV